MNNSRRDRWRASVSPRALLAAGMLAVGTLGFVTGGVYFSDAKALAPSSAAVSQTVPATSPKLVSQSHQFSFADLVERVAPAVVSVQVDMAPRVQNSAAPGMGTPEIPAPFRDFFRNFGEGPEGRALPGPQRPRGARASGLPRAGCGIGVYPRCERLHRHQQSRRGVRAQDHGQVVGRA